MKDIPAAISSKNYPSSILDLSVPEQYKDEAYRIINETKVLDDILKSPESTGKKFADELIDKRLAELSGDIRARSAELDSLRAERQRLLDYRLSTTGLSTTVWLDESLLSPVLDIETS